MKKNQNKGGVYSALIAGLIFWLAMTLAQPVAAVEAAFSDVPEAHWAYAQINQLRELRITDGIGDNRFGLGQTLTRAQFAAFLGKLMGWEPAMPLTGSYADNQDATAWYYGWIEAAVENGALTTEAQLFRPSAAITREEMAVMLVRGLGYAKLAESVDVYSTPFEDVEDNAGYILLAKDFGIINGTGEKTFSPKASATREQAAAMLIRMYDKISGEVSQLHAFYAIQSAGQSDLIPSMDSVSFGWSQMEYDAATGNVVLNTQKDSGNEYGLPEGYEVPLQLAEESDVSKQLMVLLDYALIYPTDNPEGITLAEFLLTDEDRRGEAVDSILAQAQGLGMDGVVIDFENMKGAVLKEAFNAFLKALKQRTAAEGMQLIVTVQPQMLPGQAYYDGYDFRTIGEVADKVILMAHDYYARTLSEAEMASGFTVTPVTPFDQIYAALKAITDEQTGIVDTSKIWLQISFDSVQWQLREGVILNSTPYHPTYDAIANRLGMPGTTVHYSETYQNPYATYFNSDSSTDNVIWYEDSRSVKAKIDLAKMFGINGISLWRLGTIPQLDAGQYLDIWNTLVEE